MRTKTKRWLIIGAIVICILLMLSLILVVFFYYHPTYYKFNDRFIIGSSIDEIVERYGPFDGIDFNNREAYDKYAETKEYSINEVCSIRYSAREKVVDFLGTTPPVYYEIFFDSLDGIATRVSLVNGGKGG